MSKETPIAQLLMPNPGSFLELTCERAMIDSFRQAPMEETFTEPILVNISNISTISKPEPKPEPPGFILYYQCVSVPVNFKTVIKLQSGDTVHVSQEYEDVCNQIKKAALPQKDPQSLDVNFEQWTKNRNEMYLAHEKREFDRLNNSKCEEGYRWVEPGEKILGTDEWLQEFYATGIPTAARWNPLGFEPSGEFEFCNSKGVYRRKLPV